MSKLAHSNDKTMAQIERQYLKDLGEDPEEYDLPCLTCGGSGFYKGWDRPLRCSCSHDKNSGPSK